METGIKAGSFVERTVDLLTGIGSVILVHSDKEIIDADVAKMWVTLFACISSLWLKIRVVFGLHAIYRATSYLFALLFGRSLWHRREIEKKNELFEYEKSGALFTAVSQRHLSGILVNEGDEC